MSSTHAQGPGAALQETLFGDVPLAMWGEGVTGGAWDRFAAARGFLSKGDTQQAAAALTGVLSMKGVESRQTLQAWAALRDLGVKPQGAEAKRVLGVVIEVPMEDGLDVLAAYEDETVRFIHHMGSVIVVDSPVPAVSAAVKSLLEASRRVVAVIGPHDGPRFPAPTGGMVRLSFLTPSGLHFGQGPMEVFFRDGMAGPVLGAATALMQRVLALAGNGE